MPYTDTMEEELAPIKRSPRGLQAQLALSAVTLMIIGLIITAILGRIFSWTTGGGATLIGICWLVLLLAWVVGACKLWFDWKARHYEIGEDTLVFHAKAGGWGSAETVYRYESIISVRMTQGFLGKQFGYGNLHITIPDLKEELVMRDVEDPKRQMRDLRARIEERSRRAGSAAYVI